MIPDSDSIIASCVLIFYSPYRPGDDDTYAAVLTFLACASVQFHHTWLVQRVLHKYRICIHANSSVFCGEIIVCVGFTIRNY